MFQRRSMWFRIKNHSISVVRTLWLQLCKKEKTGKAILSALNPAVFVVTWWWGASSSPLSQPSALWLYSVHGENIQITVFKKIILLLFNYSCLNFLHPPPPPQPNPPPSLASTLPFGFVRVSFIVVPENPSPHCSLPPPLWLLLDCS